MKVRVSDIKENGIHIEALKDPQWLENVPELCREGSPTKLTSSINIDLQLTKVLKEVSVSGNIEFSIDAPCSRCMETVNIDINPPVELIVTPAENISEEDEDLDHVTYAGDEMDLTNFVREQIAISLPIKVTCNENCKGLCSECGANLNKEVCDCERDQVDPRFAVLKNLKV